MTCAVLPESVGLGFRVGVYILVLARWLPKIADASVAVPSYRLDHRKLGGSLRGTHSSAAMACNSIRVALMSGRSVEVSASMERPLKYLRLQAQIYG